jgi:hypothetical protein
MSRPYRFLNICREVVENQNVAEREAILREAILRSHAEGSLFAVAGLCLPSLAASVLENWVNLFPCIRGEGARAVGVVRSNNLQLMHTGTGTCECRIDPAVRTGRDVQ